MTTFNSRLRCTVAIVLAALCTTSIVFCQTASEASNAKNDDKGIGVPAQVDDATTNDQLFEIVVPPPTAKPGEYVLCPSRQFYDRALKNGVEKSTFSYYAAKMVEVGEHQSKVANLAGRTFEIPNQLIISIPPKQECNKGDILLTWWQSGSGMQRAIVVGGTKTQPVVRYLDITLDNPSGWGKKEGTLKPDTFVLLNKQWQIGSAVIVKEGRQKKHGLILAVSDEHVLVREFAGKLNCHDRDKVTSVPIVPDVVADDIAMAAWHGSFKPVTVTKVDTEIGRVFVNFQLARKGQEKVIAFGDLYKKAAAQEKADQ